MRWWWPSLGFDFDAFGGAQALASVPLVVGVGCLGWWPSLGFDALADGAMGGGQALASVPLVVGVGCHGGGQALAW